MSQPKRILLLAFHFPPAAESGAARPYRFYKYLPEFGYEPHVVTSAESTLPRVCSVPAPTRVPDRNTAAGFLEAVLRKFVFPYDDAVLWSAAAYKAARAQMQANPFHAVISTFPPINTHLAAYALKRKFNIPWIADFRDPLFKPGIRDSAADRMLEKRFIHAADVAVFVADTVHDEAAARYPDLREKFRLLWNGYDPDEALDALDAPPGPRVLLHAGNLYNKRRPAALLHSLSRLVRNGRLASGRIVLRLMGNMDPQIRVTEAESIEYLEGCGVLRLEPSLPRAAALTEIRRADSLLLMDMTDGHAGFTVPAKLFEYVRVGRPILTFTTPASPVARILERSGVAHQVIVSDDTPEMVDRKVLTFFDTPNDPKAPSQWFVDEFDGRQQAARLAKWLDELNARRLA